MYFAADYFSPIGKILIASDGEAVCGLWFYGQKHFPSFDNLVFDELAIFDKVRHWLDDYFKGDNPEIDFRLNPDGTDFRMKVWKILCEIPYGETVTYGEIASRLSNTMSAQAVGGAVGHNPIAILIPCHRVLGSGGKLTGYAGGIERKIELLKLENEKFDNLAYLD